MKYGSFDLAYPFVASTHFPSQTPAIYSIFPIVEINKTTPPWFSVMNEYLMLALIVPGKRQLKNMGVYLQPLIDELKELWEGIQVYDVSRPLPS